jgi:hypothetical protein
MSNAGHFQPGHSANPGGVRKDGQPKAKRRPNLLSAAYKHHLGQKVSEDIRQAIGAEEGATWAEAIGLHMVKRAVGKVKDDEICFVAVKEIRESTEGKTPEKLIAAGTNEELTALAKIMAGDPAPPDSPEDEVLEGDKQTEDDEATFHEDGRDEE